MNKWIKRTAWVFVLILVLLVLVYQAVLRTQLGTRWAIGFFVSNWIPELRYNKITGSLVNGMTLTDVLYHDAGVEVAISELATGDLAFTYFSPAISLSDLKVNGMSLKLKPDSSHTAETAETFIWQGFEMPVDVMVPTVQVNNILVVQEEAEDLLVDHLKLSIKAQKDVWNISQLAMKASDMTFNADALIQTHAQLNMHLESDWQWLNKDLSWQAELNLEGDKNKLSGQLNQSYQDGVLAVKTLSEINLEALFTAIQYDIKTSSEQLTLTDNQGNEWFAHLSDLQVNGGLESYQITGDAAVQAERFNDVDLTWKAEGDLSGVAIQFIEATGGAGKLNLSGDLRWNAGLHFTGALRTDDFNPAWLSADWPGKIDALTEFDAEWKGEDIWHVTVPEMRIDGSLKQAPLQVDFSGELSASQEALITASGHWGENQLQAKATHEFSAGSSLWHSSGKLSMNQLSLLDELLDGKLNGDFMISQDAGDWSLSSNLKGHQLSYDNMAVSQADVKLALSTAGQLAVNAVLNDADISGERINNVSLSIDGSIAQHDWVLDLNSDAATSKLLLTAGYQQDTGKYLGHISKHQLHFPPQNMSWTLAESVAFQWQGGSWQINTSCWQSESASNLGQLCFEAEAVPSGLISGGLKLSEFDLENGASFIPEGLALMGQLNGNVAFDWHTDLKLDAQMDLQNGWLVIDGIDETPQKLAFEHATLTANQVNNETSVKMALSLEDGSFLNLLGDLTQDNNANMLIDGQFDGYLADNDLVSSFSSEIKEMSGELKVTGDVSGPLKQPKISAQFALEGGDIKLDSFDVPLKQVKADLKSTTGNSLHYKVSALAAKTVENHVDDSANQKGQLIAEGDILFNEKQGLKVTSEISGQDFLVADGSQLVLSLSPQIKVDYSSSATQVTGEIQVPRASINIKEVPASVTTLPGEVEYVDVAQDKTQSTVLLDVKAKLTEKVKLSVLGLVADLSGELQLKNGEENQDIKAYGQLTLTDGVYEIYGQALEITQGLLIFDGPLDNPILQIKAERTAQNKQVAGIKITGDVNNFKSTLYAIPPLSEAETLSYIVTGKGLSDLEGTRDSDAITDAVLMMGLKQNSELIDGLKDGLGIDVLNFSSEAGTGATVEAGKNIGNKVFVGYNQGIFKHIGYWLLRYQINDKLSLETKQGEEQSVDVVYSREKK